MRESVCVNFGPPTTQLLWNSRCVKSCSYPTPTRTVMYCIHRTVSLSVALLTLERKKVDHMHSPRARQVAAHALTLPARAWSETRAPRSALLFRTSGGGRPRAPRVGMRWPAWTMVAGAQTPRQSECESFHVLSFLHGNSMRFWFHDRTRQQVLQNYHAPSATRARPRGRITISIRSRETGAP
jgi:hypothetical protein